MAKSYPNVDLRTHRDYIQTANFVETKLNILIRQVTKTTTSGTTPGYPKVIRENGFSTQTTIFHSYPRTYNPFQGNNNYKGYSYVSAISGPTFVGPSTSQVSQCEYKALLDMYDKIPQITANLALLYAERKKTGESILIALNGILKCVRSVRKGKVPELFMSANQLRTRKRYTGAWLNYVYGIKPFALDLYAIACSDLPQIAWLKGKCTISYERYVSTDQKRGAFIRNAGTYKTTFKGGLSLSNPLTATLAGSGMLNPALIAWELTPFSFMADWLLPVGPYLEMLASTAGYNKHSGSVTRGTKEDYWQTNENGASAEGYWKRINRSTISFPGPPLPRFKNPYSPVHALNALSIIHQFVKDPGRR